MVKPVSWFDNSSFAYFTFLASSFLGHHKGLCSLAVTSACACNHVWVRLSVKEGGLLVEVKEYV